MLYHVQRYNGSSKPFEGSFHAAVHKVVQTAKQSGATARLFNANLVEIGKAVYDSKARAWGYEGNQP